jgi:hypothetical protein
MHAGTTRFSISFQSPEMSGTGNHIGLSETAAETIDFRISLLLPRINKLPEIIVFSLPETHRLGPARSGAAWKQLYREHPKLWHIILFS